MTGEAVVLGLRAAKLPSRALAMALDLTAQFVGLLVTSVVLALASPGIDDAAGAALTLGLTVFFLVALPVLIETLSRGRSLGKLAFGLRVVRNDGGPVRFRHSLVRGLVAFAEIILLLGVPAVISSLVSTQGRRLGDVFAGTLVVRERVPGAGRGREALPSLPPALMQALGGELMALDLSAVPDGLWLAIRQYLGRLDELDPAVAHGMAQRLVGDVVAHTGHAAPYGVHPAAYLGAVLAERQRREWARAAEAQQRTAVPYAATPHAPMSYPPMSYAGVPQPGTQRPGAPVRINAAWAAQAAQQQPQPEPQAPAPAAPAQPQSQPRPQPEPPVTPPTGFAPPA
ncbi:putative RDD family membrane protein YckC [Kitasatospora atroaurantiaca]|uniref:Putative RDD family membrane protein YckC n=1 Tax=Kitasatospora atroaurantiaca TaxID=285545 RepID=A0A561EPU9_9ACTN|nr:putative RDD family membrane protein YckC [Kitasatospora atroaurantiaca]